MPTEKISAYLEYLQALQRSPGTIQSARYALEVFRRWCEERQVCRLDELSPRHLEEFRQALAWNPGPRGRLYAAHSVDLFLRMTRAYLRWALPNQGPLDPTRGLLLPRQKKRPLRLLSPAELARLLEGPDLAEPLGLRDRLLLELVCEGLSLAEVSRLDLADHFERRLRVRSPRDGLTQSLQLDEELRGRLLRYLDRGRPHLSPRTPALLVSPQGQRFSTVAAWETLQRWAQQASLARSPSPQELAASRQAERQAFAERRFFFNRDL